MNSVRLSLIFILFATAAFGQLTARNPVDELKDQVTRVLADSQVPLTPDQERQLALLIEEERQAAENLFGVTWDFSQGPPQGEQPIKHWPGSGGCTMSSGKSFPPT